MLPPITCKANQMPSNPVFQFGGVLDYDSTRTRYEPKIWEEEQQRKVDGKMKLRSRQAFLRDWRDGIESHRIQRRDQHYEQAKALVQEKSTRTRVGESSTGYNIISCGILPNPKGDSLRTQDANAMYRMNLRGASLYLKRNTFHPILCQDLPSSIVAQPGSSDNTIPKTESPPAVDQIAHQLATSAMAAFKNTSEPPTVIVDTQDKDRRWTKIY